MELLGLLRFIMSMLKTLYLKRIRKNMTKKTLEGMEKENVSFHTVQHKKKKKKTVQQCHSDSSSFVLAGMIWWPYSGNNKKTLKKLPGLCLLGC